MAIILGTRILLLLSLGALYDQQAKWRYVGRGIASGYTPWRKGPFVPYGRYPGNWRVKPTPKDLVCAHRTLPFGTLLRLRANRTNRTGFCVVLDRGPYGFCTRATPGKRYPGCRVGYRYIIKKRIRERRQGYYRGIVDATLGVHRLMGTRGWVMVTVERLARRERSRRVLKLKDVRGLFPVSLDSSPIPARWIRRLVMHE